MKDENLVTAKQIADMLSVSIRTFYKWVNKGSFDVAPIRLSQRTTRYRLPEVLEFLEKTRKTTPQQPKEEEKK